MTQTNNNSSYVKDKKNELTILNPAFDDFFTFKLGRLSYYSQQTNLNALSRVHELTDKFIPKDFTKNDIKNLLNNEKFKKLSNRTKNTYLSELKKYFDYFERKDLVELIPKYTVKLKELNKTELITRKELDLILKNVNTQKKAMIMVNYEGALRRDELTNILFRNVQFEEGFVEIYLKESKTVKRNITLIESIPYLKEYINESDFKPDDKIFPFHPQWITTYYSRLTNKLKKKYPDWKKKIYPHLLRHSRLTELALTKLNEPQLRRFAGWTKDSQMSSVYFHIDDTDIRNILVEQNGYEYKKPKSKTFKKIICELCKTENNQQNAFCYKCGHVVNKERIVVDRIEEKADIQELKIRNKGLEQTLDELKDTIGFMSKFMLSLNQAFREETEEDYYLNTEEPITYTKEEMIKFRERVESFLKK